MTKISLFMNILFLLIAIIFSAISQCSSALSTKRLCYDPKCSEPVSLARTVITYTPKEAGLLPFDINVEVKVYSKEAGSRNDLWGVEINGKHGYVPKNFLKEYKILHKNLNYEVPINQLPNNANISSDKKHQKQNDNTKFVKNSKPLNAQPDSSDAKSKELPSTLNDVAPSYEVIDGTTIHLDNSEPSVLPSFVTEVVQSTVSPGTENIVGVDSSISSSNEKIESDTSVRNNELPQKTIEASKQLKHGDISSEINIKDFLSSSEEISDLPEIVGIEVPSLVANISSESKLYDKVESEIKTVKDDDVTTNVSHDNHADESNVKDTQPSEEVTVVSSTNASLAENDQKVDVKDTKSTVLANNTESVSVIKSDEENSIVGATVVSTHNNQETETQDTETSNSSDLNGIPIIEKDATQFQINQTESINENKNSEQDAIKTSTEDLASTTLVESDSKDVKKDIQPQDVPTEQTVISETTESNTVLENEPIDKHLNDSANIIVNEEHIPDNLEHQNLNITSTIEAPTVSVSSSSDKLDFAENDNTTSILIKQDTEEIEQQTQDSIAEKVANSDILTEDAVPDALGSNSVLNDTEDNEINVNSDVHSADDIIYDSNSAEVPNESSELSRHNDEKVDLNSLEENPYSSQKNLISEGDMNINEFRDRNLLYAEAHENGSVIQDVPDHLESKILPDYEDDTSNKDKVLHTNTNIDYSEQMEQTTSEDISPEVQDVCLTEYDCEGNSDVQNQNFIHENESPEIEGSTLLSRIKMDHNYWLTLMYLSVSVGATLIFSLGYYYIENMRRDGQLIAKINKLEKDLLVSTKECTMLTENLKVTKEKLTCIEDESFGSNEMVVSLKADLEALQNTKAELEDQVAMLEKDLETATEAGLELERMLREVLSSNNEVNPLAQSVEDLQARLNEQQAANESLKNALNLKTQENETLSADLISLKTKYEELEVELVRVTENLKTEVNQKNDIEKMLTNKVQRLEMQIKEISTEKTTLQKELKSKEVEIKDLVEVIDQLNSNNLDLAKLYDVSRIKAEATALLEERNELKIRLSEVEGAHSLLEEHMKVIKEEVATLGEQCKIAEKEKKDAETRLEVLSAFFKEKEAQRQKDEAIWLQKQGEVVSTVERIQTMQNEIQNYKQQIEMLKHEILDQEREYKGQISLLETKAHEQWVVARQVERRLEESKAEAGQLRNRLTLIEKNINDGDSEAKIHRLEANGETTTSPPLFIGAESSSSPIMFSGSSGVPPPPPPSYMHSLFPPYLPPPLPSTSGVPPYDVGQRPPPLGGRLSSPPPMPLHPPTAGRYENASSPPPPMSPHLLPPFNHHRSPPPPPFGSDHIHPPPPPSGSMLPPPLGTTHPWGEEPLPPPRNSGFHPPQREQRVRNHKGSLHSSGESLDKTHHSSKV